MWRYLGSHFDALSCIDLTGSVGFKLFIRNNLELFFVRVHVMDSDHGSYSELTYKLPVEVRISVQVQEVLRSEYRILARQKLRYHFEVAIPDVQGALDPNY